MKRLSFGSHIGTHMDAPYHYFEKGKTLDRMPLDVVIGEARVIKIEDKESIKVEELKKFNIKKGERIIFKTINSIRCYKNDEFRKDYVYLTSSAAKYLADKKVKLVGIDYLSIGGYKKDGKEAHQALLGNGVYIVEGLNLSKAKEGRYNLVCLPLRILNSDGAPARVVLCQKNKLGGANV